jgi:hypothetical protein
MGMDWILEVVSYYYQKLTILWIITDLISCSQGVLIFVIFVCKQNVLILLNKRLRLNRFIQVKDEPKTNCNTTNITNRSRAFSRAGVVESQSKTRVEVSYRPS